MRVAVIHGGIQNDAGQLANLMQTSRSPFARASLRSALTLSASTPYLSSTLKAKGLHHVSADTYGSTSNAA